MEGLLSREQYILFSYSSAVLQCSCKSNLRAILMIGGGRGDFRYVLVAYAFSTL